MVQVKVSEGILQGEEIQNEYGGTYYSFKGIPYAQPPLGNLRFKAPQPVQSWKGVRNATKFGPISYQYCNAGDAREEMSEDCLYLNVYTPDPKPSKLLPVMIFIQGGGFISGSGNDDFFGPEFLVRNGVLLVTFNHRLEAVGFLNLDTPDIPGNAGMKDQVEVFRWVNKNIRNFGGDPDNVTIFGNSMGACCIVYHLISPMTKGLFQRAIAQSGSAVCWFAEDFESREKALLLAKQLGCFSEDDKTVYEFFKKQPIESLVNLKLPILKAQKPYELYFTTVNEKDFGQERFFYGNIVDALQRDVHEGVEIMIGYIRDEGLMALAVGCALKDLINEAKYFTEFFVPGWIKRYCATAEQLEVGRKMRQFYLINGDVREGGVLKFLNFDTVNYAVTLTAKILSKTNQVYFYKFNCQTERNIFAKVDFKDVLEDKTVVCHGDELAYIFPLKSLLGKVKEESETFKEICKVTRIWTNFAKFGNPTPTRDYSLGIKWKLYTSKKQEYLDISNVLRMDMAPDKEEQEFWDSIFRKYLPKYTFSS